MSFETDHVLVASVFAGLIGHAIFKRREPTIPEFFAVLGAIAGAEIAVARLPILLVLASIATFVASLTLSIFIYRISPLHPLYKIPGPFLARVSQLYLFTVVWHGQTRKHMQFLHNKYGPIIRIGPNEVTTSDIPSVLTIHGARGFIKGKSYAAAMSGNPHAEDSSLISLRTHASHATRRKIWDKAFAMESLKDYQVVIHARVNELCRQLDARAGQPVDLHTWFGYFVWDVMTDLAYGGGGDKLKTGSDTGSTIESLVHTIHVAGTGKLVPWAAPYLKTLRSSGLPDFRENASKLFQKRLLDGRVGEEKDVFYHLLGEGSEKGTDINEKALAADSALVIAAGADTTRLVLALLFFLIVKEPKHFTRLQNYLDETLGDDEFPRNEALMHMPLLEAYINETLRLNTAVPFSAQREVPVEGAVLAGHFIAGGNQARIAGYAMHRNPDWYSQPDEFIPDRWLPDSGFKGVHQKAAFAPFLHGPYHCVGRNFALQEMRMLVATLVRRYDITFAPGFDPVAWEEKIEDRNQIEIHTALSMVLTRRK